MLEFIITFVVVAPLLCNEVVCVVVAVVLGATVVLAEEVDVVGA